MIIAVDFDGTLCDEEYPGIGRPHMDLIKALIYEREQGHKLILWTCREGKFLDEAVNWCKSNGLGFDAINDNLEEEKQKWGNNPRKVAADIYIDDRAYTEFDRWRKCSPQRANNDCAAVKAENNRKAAVR